MENRRQAISMSEKKALFIATVGGFVTQFEQNNVSLLQQMGYEVHSAANFNEPVYSVKEQELKKKGIILHQVEIAKSPFLWRQNLRALKQICSIIEEEGITLIHCHTPVGGLLGRLAAILQKERGIKVIYTAHGFHFYKGAPWINWLFYYNVERLLARHTDILVTINEEDYARAQNFRLRKNGKVYKIPGEGLNLEAFRPVTEERRQQLRRKLGIDEDVFYILSVGELSGNKNHKEIIRLIPDMKKKLPEKKLLYGICGDGYYRQELKKLVAEMGLEEEAKLYGYRENPAEYIACADCLVFPSIREGLGMAALEAMAMGIPVIASDNRGTREYMEDGSNGFVCNVRRPEEFVNAVEKICHMSREELYAMGREGRKTAEKFEISNTNVIMSEVYLAAEEKREPVERQRSNIRYIPSQESSIGAKTSGISAIRRERVAEKL